MNQENSDGQPKGQFRVVIDREANDALESYVAKLNRDNDTSKVSKSDLANFIFQRIDDLLGDADIADIRAKYFDAKKAIEVILKGGATLPGEIHEALLKHCGIKPATKEKRAKKLSTPKLVDNVS